jgi:hypothetical protein
VAGYQVVTAVVRKEAAKWDEFADEIGPVRDAIASMTLDPLAFFVLDAITFATIPLRLPAPPEELARSYEDMRSFVEKLLGEAQIEFIEIAGALLKIAYTYEQAEAVVELELDQVY